MRSSIDVHNNLLADDIPHELSQLSGPLRDLSAAPAVLGLPTDAVARPTVLTDQDGVVVILAPAHQDVVYTAAGEPGVILKVRGVDLVKVTSAVVSSVTTER